MSFLLNDVVLELEGAELSPSAAGLRYRRLSLDFVNGLASELYAQDPRLQVTQPARARRLAIMIAAVAPRINAALFVAPAVGCEPDAVYSRFETISPALMSALMARQRAGALNGLIVDRQIWRRLAA
ncbi:MAG TPA: hypothetical protein VFC47_04295 [Caulobacteraceae bacterium]|nr:hypothetical protein [Caulobacteraceae bacterium]